MLPDSLALPDDAVLVARSSCRLREKAVQRVVGAAAMARISPAKVPGRPSTPSRERVRRFLPSSIHQGRERLGWTSSRPQDGCAAWHRYCQLIMRRAVMPTGR
eukprot:3645058-Pyramimonas_sp.AAC.1